MRGLFQALADYFFVMSQSLWCIWTCLVIIKFERSFFVVVHWLFNIRLNWSSSW